MLLGTKPFSVLPLSTIKAPYLIIDVKWWYYVPDTRPMYRITDNRPHFNVSR